MCRPCVILSSPKLSSTPCGTSPEGGLYISTAFFAIAVFICLIQCIELQPMLSIIFCCFSSAESFQILLLRDNINISAAIAFLYFE